MSQFDPDTNAPDRVSANAWLSVAERDQMAEFAKQGERSLAAEMRLAVRSWIARKAKREAA